MSKAEDEARAALRASMDLNGDRRKDGGMSEIDPQEFGEVRANVRALMENDKAKTESLDKLATAVQAIQLQLAEAKGGWKFFLAAGSACASAGGIVTWFVHEVLKR